MKHIYLFLAALMLLCLAPMPYGYFQLVRFVAMVAFGLMAYRYYVNNRAIAAVVFGVLVLPDSIVEQVEAYANIDDWR